MRTRRIVGTVLAGTAFLWQLPAGAQQPQPGAPENNVAQADQPRSFAIPPQPLPSALERFADQAGISFAYRTGDLSSVASPGVSGTLTPREALARLLAGTGVTFAFTGTNTVTLARADAGAGAVQLRQFETDSLIPNAQNRGQDRVPRCLDSLRIRAMTRFRIFHGFIRQSR